MNNKFLKTLENSFIIYLKTGARSNEKLKVLHSFISQAIQVKLGPEYRACSLGIGNGKEKKVQGRYMDKTIDITIEKKGKAIAGIAVKFVMSNYSQNSNNYFENMLGETANIRASNIPYFQIFAIPQTLPYFSKDKKIMKWENISQHNLDKYIKLSNDNIDLYYHTPNKTLITIFEISPFEISKMTDEEQFVDYFINNNFTFTYSNTPMKFGQAIVYNNFEVFIDKVYHTIKSL